MITVGSRRLEGEKSENQEKRILKESAQEGSREMGWYLEEK